MSSMIHTIASGVFESDPLCPEFQLIVRQNPECAKVAIGKEKDRKPVDPPPILQLKCTSEQSQYFLQSPYFFCSCALAPENENGSLPPPNSIVGTLVSSLHKLKDSDNTDGGFFVFGDLSVKQEGRFRLQFDLFELRDGDCVHRTTVRSDVFTVHSPKNFPGMAESTFLTRSFSDQGVRLRLRKDSRALTSRKRTSTAADLGQMVPRKMEVVGRGQGISAYYDDSLESVKRRKFSQEQGPSPHHSIATTPYGARSVSSTYAVDTIVAVTQGLMSSPVSYAPQPPVLPRPTHSPGSYTPSPQSYGIPVQVSLGPESSQSYAHPSISAATEVVQSHRYALAPLEATSQSYSIASLHTPDPQHTPQSYHSMHGPDSAQSYQSQTQMATQLPSLDYALPTPDAPQESSMARPDGLMARIPVTEGTGSIGSGISSSLSWQQQAAYQSPTASHGPQTISSAAMGYTSGYAPHRQTGQS